MLVTAIWLGALALGLAGGALALAVVALVRDRGTVRTAPVQEMALEEQEELLRRGMANLMGYDPQESREGEV